jgi:hypothetical protein
MSTARWLGRWLSLTLVQHGTWPLLVILAGAPLLGPAGLSWPWTGARSAGPVLAAAAAAIFVWGRGSAAPDFGARAGNGAGPPRGAVVRGQIGAALIVLAAVVAVARLMVGPAEPVGRLLLVGGADVAAFQLIHFGVVARSFAAGQEDRAQGAAVLLFGVSWGLRDLALTALAGGGGLAVAFGAGLGLGIAVGLLSRLLRWWPGGALTAAAGHWLVVYLVGGFIGLAGGGS